ncbi:MAG TPA: acyl-CoA synthetase FdrA [Chloroflexota bacterium]|jgi:succinyl-CoA synthetase alpha subunit
MVAVRTLVRPNSYRDSVVLMRLSGELTGLPDVLRAAAMMATGPNKALLAEAGLLDDAGHAAGPADLLIGVAADSAAAAERALAAAAGLLEPPSAADAPAALPRARTLGAALRALPTADLAIVSVPGEFAAAEAEKALLRDLHVLLFSDNVPLDQEVALKRLATRRGLLLMGPDAGTALIGGVGLGFANAVRRGPIGLVSASGTGLQAVSSLVHRYGSGVSHGIGTGSRDMAAAVGGLMMRQGIDLLADDPETAVLVLISKPPDLVPATAVYERIRDLRKPVVTCFLNAAPESARRVGAHPVTTLDQAAALAIRLAGEQPALDATPQPLAALQAEAARLAPSQQYVRGLYVGGTLAYEAQVVVQPQLTIYSNAPLTEACRLPAPHQSVGHTIVDLGADEFTVGRPHPMIDGSLRAARLLAEADDPETAVLLLDVVLGYGAHGDPAGALAPALAEARARAAAAGRYLPVVASICGTDGDPQGLRRQEAALRAAGALVLPTNAQAARAAAAIALRGASVDG